MRKYNDYLGRKISYVSGVIVFCIGCICLYFANDDLIFLMYINNIIIGILV